jgi:hypothetical protein
LEEDIEDTDLADLIVEAQNVVEEATDVADEEAAEAAEADEEADVVQDVVAEEDVEATDVDTDATDVVVSELSEADRQQLYSNLKVPMADLMLGGVLGE